jgi:hypothetical protein
MSHESFKSLSVWQMARSVAVHISKSFSFLSQNPATSINSIEETAKMLRGLIKARSSHA